MTDRIKKPGFLRRLNFFKGLFLQAEDWQKEQAYHIIKQRYHNKYLHTPGVVRGCLKELRVTAAKEGSALSIAPGFAIDGEGRDIYLPEAIEIDIPPLRSFKPPTTIYVAANYHEKGSERRSDDANPAYTGWAFIEEGPRISVTPTIQGDNGAVELARIALGEDTTTIRDPVSFITPEPGEIDMTHVLYAGTPTPERGGTLTIDDFGVRVMDTTVEVRVSNRKERSTNVLIETIPDAEMRQPMYMIHVQSLDNARLQWWIGCERKDDSTDYTLHIVNDTNNPITVMCRVYRMRTG